MRLATLIPLVLKVSIVLNVFGLGLNASAQDATYLFRRPHQLLRSLLAMHVVMLLCATVLAVNFALHPAVKIALVALAVSPIPPLLPKKTRKAGGEASYAIGLVVAAALLAGYVGTSAALDESIAHFALAYADQTERDLPSPPGRQPGALTPAHRVEAAQGHTVQERSGERP